MLLDIHYSFSLNGSIREKFRDEAGVAIFPSSNVSVECIGIISLDHKKNTSRLSESHAMNNLSET